VEQGASYASFGIALHRGQLSSYQLVLAAQRGDAIAFQELIHTYDAMVMRVALSLTASEVDAQEIYCRVFKEAFAAVNTLDSGSSVFIWLYRILVRHCLEYCRRSSGAWPRRAAGGSEPGPARALLALPPMERVVFQLKQFHGLRSRTLAEIFNTAPEFIVTTLRSAISQLRVQAKTASSHLDRPPSSLNRF
jgi:RNA polymerase sigma-70 factor, ECF subfamily